jgi:phosphatidylserine/phosphatidylglycerophosphate/cardiolipin synthase-like enzyme/uncharacterized membrane protein YdjX (TVP38/TMEM64 family)
MRIVEAGRNCWRTDRASRFAMIQDGAEYFQLVRHAVLRARHTVFILGWDITGHIDLEPGVHRSNLPTHLDKLLAYVTGRRPALRCYILIWDYGSLYTLERDPLSRWRLGWRMPRRVHFGFDDRHPVGACHHQKVVVVDDHLGFCGGIDLTSHRWDTSAHRTHEPRRKTPLGIAYGPYHEVQAMVDGPAAAALGVLCRERWRALGAERLPPVRAEAADIWPSTVVPDLTDVDVAIARTIPGAAGLPAVRECEALFLDAIAAARRSIYIENQYFTNATLAAALAARLREPDGPEVIVVTPKECDGWLERNTIGAFRDSAFRELLAADLHGRLRLVYPVASRAEDVPVFVHSKVMLVDDALVRVGSANCSHRSMGVDTECDLAVDGAGDPTVRSGIARVRDRLIAEHLGLPAAGVPAAIGRAGSLRALIDAHEHGDHALARIELGDDAAAAPSETLRAAVDPDKPVGVGASMEHLMPAIDAASGRGPFRVWILLFAVLAAAGVLAWAASPFGRAELRAVQEALDAIPATRSFLLVAIGGFAVSSLLLLPVELLAIAAGLLLGALRGGLVAIAGSLAAAAGGYLAGRAIGAPRLARWIGGRARRSSRQLGAEGIGGVVVFRLAGVASARAIHLICGAGGLPFGSYFAGTAIALAPGVGLLSGLGALLGRTLIDPSVSNAALTIAAGVGLVALAAGLRTFLLIRQFAPGLSRHRARAEFG